MSLTMHNNPSILDVMLGTLIMGPQGFQALGASARWCLEVPGSDEILIRLMVPILHDPIYICIATFYYHRN